MGTRPEKRDRRARRRLLAGLAVYNLLLLLALPVLLLWLAYRAAVRRKGLGCWRHKLGLVPRATEGWPRIWLHAVSAGEMGALQPVYARLRAALPEAYVAVSTITPAGMAAAERACPGAQARFYLPFDWADCIGVALLLRVRPDLVVVTERELWPNFLGIARLMGAEVLVVNGRVSDRLRARARRALGAERWRYQLPSCLCVQSQEDAARLAAMGVSKEQVVVAGNTKADAMAARDPAAEAALAQALGAKPEELWLVAGSTHAGEEEAVVAAFAAIRARRPEARLLLAPRHLERVTEVCAQVAEAGHPAARRSEGTPPREAVVVLDTMGELRSAYALGPAGFVGGTLVPIGGHNLLEPPAAGRAVLFGPHTEYCADVADLVVGAGVGFRVAGAEELAETFLRICSDDPLRTRIAEAGPALIASQQGAAQRCANIALALLREGDGG